MNNEPVTVESYSHQIQNLAENVSNHHLFPSLVEEMVACRKIGVVAPAQLNDLDSIVSKVSYKSPPQKGVFREVLC